MSSKFAGGNFPKSSLDGRNDLGYGRSDPKFFTNKQANAEFPYVVDDVEDLDSVEIDEETIDAVHKKTRSPRKYDHAGGHYDPFYYVAGNTKLSETTAAKGLSPFPDLYKGRTNGIGGSPSPSGTQRQFGFAKNKFVPGDLYKALYLSTDEENEEFYNLKDFSDDSKENNLREWIRSEILRLT